jgi:hypothetical protein
LFHGNKVGSTAEKKCVTYLYPLELKNEIRSRIPDVNCGSRDDEYDTKPHSIAIIWQNLKEAK